MLFERIPSISYSIRCAHKTFSETKAHNAPLIGSEGRITLFEGASNSQFVSYSKLSAYQIDTKRDLYEQHVVFDLIERHITRVCQS